jgi:hypothetical protein
MVVDYKWMHDRLHEFVDLCEQYDRLRDVGPTLKADVAYQEMWRAEPTIRKIFGVLDPRLADKLELDDMAGDAIARRLCHQALGIIDDREEWAARLQPDAPTLPADRFHVWVWDAASTYWETNHFKAAVNAAATSINARIQSKVDRRDISDADLMNQAFTEKPKPGQRYLQLPGDISSDRTLQSRNRALRPFADGCFAGLRNPAAHEHSEHDWHEQKALEYLAALSILARWVDECEVKYG